jgi:hypothetical protein
MQYASAALSISQSEFPGEAGEISVELTMKKCKLCGGLANYIFLDITDLDISLALIFWRFDILGQDDQFDVGRVFLVQFDG